jgi:hypothetical protein
MSSDTPVYDNTMTGMEQIGWARAFHKDGRVTFSIQPVDPRPPSNNDVELAYAMHELFLARNRMRVFADDQSGYFSTSRRSKGWEFLNMSSSEESGVKAIMDAKLHGVSLVSPENAPHPSWRIEAVGRPSWHIEAMMNPPLKFDPPSFDYDGDSPVARHVHDFSCHFGNPQCDLYRETPHPPGRHRGMGRVKAEFVKFFEMVLRIPTWPYRAVRTWRKNRRMQSYLESATRMGAFSPNEIRALHRLSIWEGPDLPREPLPMDTMPLSSLLRGPNDLTPVRTARGVDPATRSGCAQIRWVPRPKYLNTDEGTEYPSQRDKNTPRKGQDRSSRGMLDREL